MVNLKTGVTRVRHDYKKFKKYKLYGGDKATSAIKAYDDNDNLVGFFMPFHPDYFEKRYGEND